jgi:hypothetical protein
VVTEKDKAISGVHDEIGNEDQTYNLQNLDSWIGTYRDKYVALGGTEEDFDK